MAKIPFDIKFRPQIESGEYKVETRGGKPARIVCWDYKRNKDVFDLLVCVVSEDDRERELAYSVTTKGARYEYETCEDDLFIVTPEPELTDWEGFISGCLQKHGLLDCGAADRIAKNCSTELLNLARKEIMDGWSKGLRDTQDRPGKAYNDGYNLGYERGRAEALKDLPRWKKATGKERFNERMIVLAFDNDLLCTNYAEEGEYYISFSDLEKLPKED